MRSSSRALCQVVPDRLLDHDPRLCSEARLDDRREGRGRLGSDRAEAFFSGAWGWFALVVVFVVFNTVIGEELLFRGLLLPRMRAVFGKRDWVANGVLFTLYHLHQPWSMPATLVEGIFLEAYPARRFQSAWMGIIVHSVQSVFVIAVVLALVL
jgi:membrane protease YdiL (CAAX protease family)